jgi:very-short-patch-repair endonuclease
MLRYKEELVLRARNLRLHLTEAEIVLWSRLRRKQLENIQFYRQKPIGPYIVDFYAPSAKLVIEVDGSEHCEEMSVEKDRERDRYLQCLGLEVLRFDNAQVLQSTDEVLEVVLRAISP